MTIRTIFEIIQGCRYGVHRLRHLAFALPLLCLPLGAEAAVLAPLEKSPLIKQASGAGLLYAAYWEMTMQRNWSGAEDCKSEVGFGCNLDEFQAVIDSLRGADPYTQISEINSFVNGVRYRDDTRIWDKKDYWATPAEFFDRGGDCEDYVIAKYLALKALGIPVDDMRLLVLQDTRRGIPHAVLMVKQHDRELVLDNQDNGVSTLRQKSHYKVRYSLNENTILRHVALR